MSSKALSNHVPLGSAFEFWGSSFLASTRSFLLRRSDQSFRSTSAFVQSSMSLLFVNCSTLSRILKGVSPEIQVLSLFPSPASVFPHGTTGSI